MAVASTVAAKCASLSSAASRIITDTANFSRRLRNSRHEVNPINADLLALKLSLDILQDDFSDVDVQFPPLVVEASAGLLECCAFATQSLHRPIVHLLASDLQYEIWKVFRRRDLERLRQDIEAVRCAFDLLLDLVVLLRDTDDEADQSVLADEYFQKSSSSEHSFLERIDVERDHVETLTEGRLPVLYNSFEKLRACTTFVLEEKSLLLRPDDQVSSGPVHIEKLQESDSMSPANVVDEPPSPVSTSNGIGAWIANVISQKAPLPGSTPSIVYSESSCISTVAIDRRRSIPSQQTFYAESITSGSRTHSSGVHLSYMSEVGSHPRVDSPNDTTKSPNGRPVTHYTTSTMISSDGASELQKITSNRPILARDNRERLTRHQKISLDQELRTISRHTLSDTVDRLLWEGADPNVEDEEFGYFYIRAAFELPTEILQLLVDYGAKITTTIASSYYSVVHATVLGKQFDNLQYLVGLGLPIDMPNANGETPLHQAVRIPGAYQIAKYLLEAGADVNRSVNGEATPFHVVMNTTRLDSRERSMLVELLLAHGADGDLGMETVERRGKGLSVLGLI